MTTRWQRTRISTVAPDGSVIDECLEQEGSLEWTFTPGVTVNACEATFWRLTRDDERTSPTAPDAIEIEDGVSAVDLIGPYALITVTGFQRGEVYRLAFVLDCADGSQRPGTRFLGVVA